MELNEMEKKMLFQAEGDCQAKVLNELYMTVRYSNNSELREAAESLMAKVRVLSDREWIWCGTFRRITGCPTRPGLSGKGSPRPGSSPARRN